MTSVSPRPPASRRSLAARRPGSSPVLAVSPVLRRLWIVAALVVALTATLVTYAGAQVAEGSLGGRVVDPDGRPLADAVVFVRHETTELRRTTRSGSDGLFTFPALPPGEWNVEASKDGYTVALLSEVWIHLAQTRRLRLVLEPSDFQEMVTESDYRPLARTGPDAGAWVTSEEVANLPLRTRTVADLASLVPLESRLTPPRAPELRVDGAVVVGAGGAVPPLSAVEEAALLSHSYGVEFGGRSGVVSLVTRSGGAGPKVAVFGLFTDDAPEQATESAEAERTTWGGTYGAAVRKDIHLFAAWERHDASGDRDWLTARASWQDASHLVNLRYLGFDGMGGLGLGDAVEGKSDALLAGLQSMPAPWLIHHLRVQWSSFDLDLDDPVGLAVGGFPDHDVPDGDVVAIRDDVFVAPGSGRHELAFGAESVDSDHQESWALYARDRWRPAERLTVTAGVRSQHVEGLGGSGSAAVVRLAPRLGLVWGLDDRGAHLLRGAAGRYRDGSGHPADQLSMGWSWQMNPFLGISVDAVAVDYQSQTESRAQPPLDYEALGVTVRSRFSDVFQVRASLSWADGDSEPAVPAGTRPESERAVVTGIFHAPADWLLAAVYRYRNASPAVSDPQNPVGPWADSGGFDLRLSKTLAFGDASSVELIAEVFDAFEESHAGAASERTGQLGLRLRF